VPEKGVGAEAFAVIRDAMKKQGKVALGCLVLRGRERQLALEVRGNGLMAYILRAHDEVRDASVYFDEIPTVKADKDMVEIAARIIDQKEGGFDPSEFKDRYDDALREMIAAKKKGQGLVDAPQPDETLRANEDETSSPREFSLEGAEGSSRSCPFSTHQSLPRQAPP
jgi:DNA end-binding protein Ku